MPTLKESIFNEIRKLHEKSAGLSDGQLNKLIFHHPDGLRLSLAGFVIVKSIFTAYSFAMPDTLKSKHQRGLSKLEFPYFITAKRLVLFSDMDAMTIKLYGSVEGFLEMCSKL